MGTFTNAQELRIKKEEQILAKQCIRKETTWGKKPQEKEREERVRQKKEARS